MALERINAVGTSFFLAADPSDCCRMSLRNGGLNGDSLLRTPSCIKMAPETKWEPVF